MNVDMFFHKKNSLRVEIKPLGCGDYTLRVKNGNGAVTLFFFDEKGLIDFKNQVVQQYEMLKRKGER